MPIQELFLDTMQVYLGSLYVNDFNAFGRTYPVNAQAEPEFRLQPEDIVRLKTRNAAGDMIPLGSFVTVKTSHSIVGASRVALQLLPDGRDQRRLRASDIARGKRPGGHGTPRTPGAAELA